MKKTFNWFICLAITTFIFVACHHDDDEGGNSSVQTVSGEIEMGANYAIDSVYVKLSKVGKMQIGDGIVARSAYKNGSFTLNLPENLNDWFLYSINDEEIPNNITISDKTVKVADFSELQAYKDGEHIGYFFKANVDPESFLDDEAYIAAFAKGFTQVMYMYADKPFTIKG
ncbi:MAG: hypothetical protein LBN18_06385, partial [Dysgonamonadaceae bacterium]|nr:hypothetical protein [Dysgonamonadaceae bacterium]